MSKTSKILLWVVLGVVLVLILSIVLTSMLTGGRTIDYSEVEQHVTAGDIDRIVERCMDDHDAQRVQSLEQLADVDRWARARASQVVSDLS